MEKSESSSSSERSFRREDWERKEVRPEEKKAEKESKEDVVARRSLSSSESSESSLTAERRKRFAGKITQRFSPESSSPSSSASRDFFAREVATPTSSAPQFRNIEATLRERRLSQEFIPQSMNFAEIDRLFSVGTGQVTFGEYRLLPLGGQNSHINPHKKVDLREFAEFILKEKEILRSSNWKIHLSFNRAQLTLAWDLIFPMLVEARIPDFKVTRLHACELLEREYKYLQTRETSRELTQGLADIVRITEGMQVTIYLPARFDDDKKLQKMIRRLLKRIEETLQSNGIQPGQIHSIDRQIGTFCSVRNVGRGHSSYDKVTDHNPDKVKDPFKDLRK